MGLCTRHESCAHLVNRSLTTYVSVAAAGEKARYYRLIGWRGDTADEMAKSWQSRFTRPTRFTNRHRRLTSY